MWAVVADGKDNTKVVIPFNDFRVAMKFAKRNPLYEVKLLAVAYLN